MKLHLGCGTNIKKGWINVDHKRAKHVDKVVNLNKFPYPFKSNSADVILISHCLEHLNDHEKVLKELHRILKRKSELIVIVPHFASSGAFSPLHKTYWNTRVFNYYSKNNTWETYSLEENKPLFTDLRKHIRFVKGKIFWNYLIEPLVNISDTTRLIYENHFAFWFPPHDIIAIYTK